MILHHHKTKTAFFIIPDNHEEPFLDTSPFENARRLSDNAFPSDDACNFFVMQIFRQRRRGFQDTFSPRTRFGQAFFADSGECFPEERYTLCQVPKVINREVAFWIRKNFLFRQDRARIQPFYDKVHRGSARFGSAVHKRPVRTAKAPVVPRQAQVEVYEGKIDLVQGFFGDYRRPEKGDR